MNTPMLYVRMVLFLSVVLSIIFGGHILIYATIKRFLPMIQPLMLKGLGLAFVILPLLFIAASLIGSRFNNLFSRIIYTSSAVWLGFAYFFFAASLLVWLIYGIARAASLSVDMQWVTGVLFVVAIGIGIYGLINANDTRVTKVTVTIPSLPEQWHGKKAVWVSDVHLGQIYGPSFAQKLALMIKDQHPDVIFIGGDLFDGSAIDADTAIKPLAQLAAPQGVYFITGNHEEFTPEQKFTDVVRRSGIRVLNNESVVRDGLRILGVDYQDSEEPDIYMKTLEGLDRTYPTILLKHAPNNIEITRKYPVDLQISGHTHDGQLWPLGYISARVFHGFDKGLNHVDGLQVYTSTGAGTWGPPLRVGTTPEIAVITLQ